MGVQVLSPESQQSKHLLRSLPKAPKVFQYTKKTSTIIKSSKPLSFVQNPNPSKTEQQNMKVARVLPKAHESYFTGKHGRMFPEVPVKDVKSSNFKDSNTSGSSRTSTPRLVLNNSNSTHQNVQNGKQHIHMYPNHHTSGHNQTSQIKTHGINKHSALTHNIGNQNGETHGVVTQITPTHISQQGNTQRSLPKIPKILPKQKPEQNRIEYKHNVYKKEGDLLSEEGNFQQALKRYNLALKFISDDKTTIIARARLYRKLGKLRKAMEDVDLVLKLDPLYNEGLLQKAELLLEQGEYESALSFFQKGARMRPDKDEFQDGMEKAKHGLAEYHKGAKKRKSAISHEDISLQKKSKDNAEKSRKSRDNVNVQNQRALSIMTDSTHKNSYRSHGSTQREPIIQEDAPSVNVVSIIPIPLAQPSPANLRKKLGRQMTPMPKRMNELKTRSKAVKQTEQKSPQHSAHSDRKNQQVVLPYIDDVDEDMMKQQVLDSMHIDRNNLEQFLDDAENIDMPAPTNMGFTAQNGLHVLYDSVLNWVRNGKTLPNTQPIPPPKETKTSAQRKKMVHGSSETLLVEHDKENKKSLRKRKKKTQSLAPHAWYNYLESKKLDEVQERKQEEGKSFLHIVKGNKIQPKEHLLLEAKSSKLGPETTKVTDGLTIHRHNEHGSNESLNQSFISKSYLPGSDLRNNKDSKGLSMEKSDPEDQQVETKTPSKKLKLYGAHKKRVERRRVAVATFVSKEFEAIEFLFADSKYDECADRASQVLEILEKEDWPDKYPYMATIHSYLGNVCISKQDVENGLIHHNKDLEISERNNIDDGVARALGNLGRVYVSQKKHQEALEVFLRKTPMCTSRIETAWLFHEIGNCFLALGDFEYAKDAAKKSFEAAEEAVAWSYQLQACVLMGVAEVKLKQYHAAFNTFEKALEQARTQGDEKAEEAIREALQDVNDRIVEEMRIKGSMNFQPESRSDTFMTPMSRSNSGLTEYLMQGLSRSRAEIAKMQAETGYRCRADYAKTPAAFSEYSSIMIPEDDGAASLTDTVGDEYDLNIDLERLQTESTLFGSSIDFHDRNRSETFISVKEN